MLERIVNFIRENPVMVILLSIGGLVGLIAPIKTLLSFLRKRDIENIKKRADSYIKEISSTDFIVFQDEVLKEYYKCYCREIYGKYFPVYTFEGVLYSLSTLRKLNEEKIGIFDTNEYKIEHRKSNYYKKYKSIMAHPKLDIEDRRVKYPDRYGFMLKELVLNNEGKISGFHAWGGTFGDNVYTSQILEYEMFMLFKEYKKFSIDKYDKIKKGLSMRNKIHSGKEVIDVLSTGCNRASLLGVNLLIIYRHHGSKNYIFTIEPRSKKVSAGAGRYHFVPVGFFECHDDTLKRHEIAKDFSIIDALFREYLEEMFDKQLDGKKAVHSDLNEIRDDERVVVISDMLERKTAFFEFLGSSVNLINLRHNLCFILMIDDENYSKNPHFKFEYNFEIDPQGRRGEKTIETVENILRNNEKVWPFSAGLWHLVQNNHLFRERFEYIDGNWKQKK